ncbi:hypothetical protein HER39_06330 [Arthrobacter deserti]|uniref:Secreted protein n=1 Tax=Arthrobacter deserti TaxID=1742687 RepID=A0ABX1JM22_9MICC|nr:hypothetical protein [Arthrobacter deserti]
MSQDIAAVIIIVAAAILPVASALPARRRRRSYPGTVRLSPGIRVRSAEAPRHFSTGHAGARPDTWWSPTFGDFASEEAFTQAP